MTTIQEFVLGGVLGISIFNSVMIFFLLMRP